MPGQSLLFSFDFRVQKRLFKLQVYEQDSLDDLAHRLSKTANLTRYHKDKIKDKLENQLKKIIAKDKCSQKIKEKIQDLLQESKIIILGVFQTQPTSNYVNKTPIRKLQQQQRSKEMPQTRNHKYLRNKQVSELLKYPSKEVYAQKELTNDFELNKKQIAKRQLYISPYQASTLNKVIKEKEDRQSAANIKSYENTSLLIKANFGNQYARSYCNSQEKYGSKFIPNQRQKQATQKVSKEVLKKINYYDRQNKPFASLIQDIPTKASAERIKQKRRFNYFEENI